MAEVDGINDHIVALARLGLDEVPLPDLLFRVSQLGVRLVSACDLATITIVDDGTPSTAAIAGLSLPELDEAQYRAGDGPCLNAHRTGEITRFDDGDPTRWPEFEATARGAGVSTTLSLPLRTQGESLGSLNMYSTARRAFDDRARELCQALAEQASVTIRNARMYWTARTLADQLQEALGSRATIDQAKGIIMGRHGVDADDAFDLLREQSQRENRKLREIAQELVESVRDRTPGLA